MRLTECGWVEVFSHIVKNAVQKRIENGQASKNIKFEQLYKDTIVEARGMCLYSNNLLPFQYFLIFIFNKS